MLKAALYAVVIGSVLSDDCANRFVDQILTTLQTQGNTDMGSVPLTGFVLQVYSDALQRDIEVDCKVVLVQGLDRLGREGDCSVESRGEERKVGCVLSLTPISVETLATLQSENSTSPSVNVRMVSEITAGSLLDVEIFGRRGSVVDVVTVRTRRINMSTKVDEGELPLNYRRIVAFNALLEAALKRRIGDRINEIYQENFELAAVTSSMAWSC